MRLIDAEEMYQWVLRATDNTAEKGINEYPSFYKIINIREVEL